MNREQVERLRKHPAMVDAKILETHISWILLTPGKVYKMKKDVQFSFLNFSTLAKRKYFCERELLLNRRLAPDLYEEVVAVNPTGSLLTFGNYQVNSVGYAVKMRRIDQKWEMQALLKAGAVTEEHIEDIATQLAVFHQNNNVANYLFNPIEALDKFADIENYFELLTPFIGKNGLKELRIGISAARSFLRRHYKQFHYRGISGFTVDGHGDLHTGNIFLEDEKPIIFDCIEFNDNYRTLDVLDELAFLYVDLEALGYQALADKLGAAYQRYNRSILCGEDTLLFDYYKCYRANVRLKVAAIKIDNLTNEAHTGELSDSLLRYYALYRKYATRLWPSSGTSTTEQAVSPTPSQ